MVEIRVGVNDYGVEADVVYQVFKNGKRVKCFWSEDEAEKFKNKLEKEE